jgi:hypothetical protein
MAGILIAALVVVLVVAVTMAVRGATDPEGDGDAVPFDPVRPDPEPAPED